MSEWKSIRVINRTGYQEIHIQLIPEPGETHEVFAEAIADILSTSHANIIRATFFGSLSEFDKTLWHIENTLSGIDFPYSWIEGDNCSDSLINGVYIFAVAGIDITRLYKDGRIVGSRFQTEAADFCCLGGLYSEPGLPAKQQAESMFCAAKRILEKAGFSYGNTVRTWFYLDGILDWYDDFNSVRTSFFLQNDIFNKLVAGSTGIGGKNPEGSRVCLELTAIKPRSDHYIIEKVESPLQCSAEDYGSAFSRAIRYSDNEYSSMTISGTASIDYEGQTLHEKDLRKQVERSFNIVMAIVESQDFSFSDIVRGYAYCRDKTFNETFREFTKNCMPDNFAFICAENDICRENLMFEIELDVIKKMNN